MGTVRLQTATAEPVNQHVGLRAGFCEDSFDLCLVVLDGDNVYEILEALHLESIHAVRYKGVHP